VNWLQDLNKEAAMSATGNDVQRSQREAMMVDCATRMAALFGRLPSLIGFTVQDSATLTADREPAPVDDELSLADVSVHTWPGFVPSPQLRAEIAAAILDVLEEHPGAREFLRGYTFARAFH
jgi:hypothetical protein